MALASRLESSQNSFMNPSMFLIAIHAAAAFRVAMHFVDKNRIKNEVESKGGRVVSISWNPFARGWFFEKNERHYTESILTVREPP